MSATSAKPTATDTPSRFAAMRRSTLFYPLIGLVAVSIIMAFAGE